MREKENRGLRVCRADLLGGCEAFVGVGGWHFDVDDRDVGAGEFDFAQQFIGIADFGDDVDAGFGEEALEPFSEQDFVVGDHDAHGISARIRASPLFA